MNTAEGGIGVGGYHVEALILSFELRTNRGEGRAI